MSIAFLCFLLCICIVITHREAPGADISILNGNINLTISSAVAGQEPSPIISETGQLQWSTLEFDPTKKITVQTSLGSPKFVLTDRAMNISAGDGTAAGEIALTTSASDFVVDIPAGIPVGNPGICTLQYKASATAADGTGTDVHTITYTIMDQ